MTIETPFTRLTGCRLPLQSAPMAGVVRDAELDIRSREALPAALR